MASLFLRNGIYNIKVYWKAAGKVRQRSYTKSLQTSDLGEAEQIRKDAEEQVARTPLRNGAYNSIVDDAGWPGAR